MPTEERFLRRSFFFVGPLNPLLFFWRSKKLRTKTLSPLCFSSLFHDFLDEILVASLLDPALSRPPLRSALTHSKTKKTTKQKKIGALLPKTGPGLLQALRPRLDLVPLCARRGEGAPPRPARPEGQVHRDRVPGHEGRRRVREGRAVPVRAQRLRVLAAPDAVSLGLEFFEKTLKESLPLLFRFFARSLSTSSPIPI